MIVPDPASAGPLTRLRTPLIIRFIKYGAVGVVNTLLSYVVYVVCLQLGVWYLAASGLALAVGAVNGYLANRRWTFEARDSSHGTVGVRYAIVNGFGFAINLALVYLLVAELGTDKLIAQAVSIVVVVLVMFAGNHWWTFAGHGPSADPAPADARRSG